MINPINLGQEAKLFERLVTKQPEIKEGITNLKNIGLSQKDLLIRTMAEHTDAANPTLTEAFAKMFDSLLKGDLAGAFQGIKAHLPNEAAMKETSLGTAIMAKGWEKPVVFPKGNGFKWLGWADKPAETSTKGLWEAAYGEQPSLIVGSVGNSNIKPEQVRNGCALSKKELSGKYEDAIKEFFAPVFKYLEEAGAKSDDIGFAFAHSDCGVDRAAREVVEKHNLKGLATTPTEYTQYLRGTECPPSAEFPNGFILADCPFPTVLTRNIGQIEDYANVYSKSVGKSNTIGIFGGGEHAFIHDTREALIGKDGSNWIPVDIMKDKFGITIPAVNENGTVTNAARNILERVNGSPYERYKYAFENFLPNTPTKPDLAQYDPQMSMATIAYTQLAKAGRISLK